MWVYFARRGRGFVKIGRSWRPDLRFEALRKKHPTLVLIGVVPAEAAQEIYAHRVLAPHRFCGEWYWPRPTVLGFIEHAVRRGALAGFRAHWAARTQEAA